MFENSGNKDWWDLLSITASCLSALGTMAAVIGALYLARRDERIRIKTTAAVWVPIDFPEQAFVGVDIVNLGRRSATVQKVYFKSGIVHRLCYLIPPSTRSSSTLPVKICDGEVAHFGFVMEQINSLSLIKTDLYGWFAWLKAHFIKVGVALSTGEHFEARVNKSLRNRLLSKAKDLRLSNQRQ